MPERAALITGASSGIGLAIAHMLGEEGHGLTVAARRPEKLTAAADELRSAGAEHRNALVVNTASIAGKAGQAWLSVYSATKAGVIGYTQSMNRELANDGIKSVALCPGFVDTPMTDFVREHVGTENMILPTDISESVRFLLRTSPNCVVPEIVFQRPDEQV
jgi:short-subunit dehydrogenase